MVSSSLAGHLRDRVLELLKGRHDILISPANKFSDIRLARKKPGTHTMRLHTTNGAVGIPRAFESPCALSIAIAHAFNNERTARRAHAPTLLPRRRPAHMAPRGCSQGASTSRALCSSENEGDLDAHGGSLPSTHRRYVDAGSPVASSPQVEQLPCEAEGSRPRFLA